MGPELAHRPDGFCRKHGIKVPTTHAKPYSTDRNLLHISYEGGVLEDPWASPPEEMFVMTTAPKAAPDTPEDHRNDVSSRAIRWPSTGAALSPAAMLAELNRTGGQARHRTYRHRGKPVSWE
jgi:argininosuccinate synthase